MALHSQKKHQARRPRALDEDTGMNEGPPRRSKFVRGAGIDKRHRDRQVLHRTDGEKPHNSRRIGNHVLRGPGGSVIGGSSATTRRIFDVEMNKVPTVSSIAKLREFIQSRYNAEAELLNLEKMVSDPFFREAGMRPPGTREAPKNAAPALWKLCSEMFPNIRSISLASNRLTSLNHIAPSALASFLPNIRALSLQDNLLSRVSLLNPLSSHVIVTPEKKGLNNLEELVLTGNPLVTDATDKGDLVNEILRRFPALKIFDLVVIDRSTLPPPKEHHNTSSERRKPFEQHKKIIAQCKFPLPVKHPGFVHSEEVQALVSQFLIKFLPLFDSDRSKLEAVYSYMPQSTFTISVNSAITERTRYENHHHSLPNQRNLVWSHYISRSRNLIRVREDKSRERTRTGAVSIINEFKSYPETRHPLDDPTKFVFDAWTHPGLLSNNGDAVFLALHGEFAEAPSQGLRSFDRTFILAPPIPGSRAQLENWPCIIVSDQLLLRAYSSPKAWQSENQQQQQQQQPLPSSSSIPINNPQLPLGVNGSVPDTQTAMVTELRQHTRLNDMFARQCLEESGWNIQQALNNFAAVRASIPPEAFL